MTREDVNALKTDLNKKNLGLNAKHTTLRRSIENVTKSL